PPRSASLDRAPAEEPLQGARDGAAGLQAGEEAAPEEGALERAVAVHAAAAEAGRLTHRVEARDGLARGVQHAARQVGLDAAEALAGEHVQLHRDERAVLLVEDLVRLRHPDELVA